MMKHLRPFHVFLFLAVLFVSGAARGQYSQAYYHRTGDTIQFDSPIYFHNWWGYEAGYQQRRQYYLGVPWAHYLHAPAFGRKILSYCFTATPIKVIGLAAITPGFGWDRIRTYDSTFRQEYFYLYDADAAALRELAAVPWLVNDSARHIRVRGYDNRFTGSLPLEAIQKLDNTTCCGVTDWDITMPIHEYYFDSAITIQDSFYVGCSFLSYVSAEDDPVLAELYHKMPSPLYRMATAPHATVNCDGSYDPTGQAPDVCGFSWPSILFKHPYTPFANDPDTLYTDYHAIPLIFPIIMVDTTVPPADYCPPVNNLQVGCSGEDDDCVVATWDAFVNHTDGYELQYGRRNQSYDQWQSLFTPTNMAHICDMTPHFGYGLRVRPFCEDGSKSGDWLEIYYFKPNELPVGIDDGSDLARHTSLSPNPASGHVTVESHFGILAIDLYDPAGRHLANHPCGSRSATLDISGLAPGFYTVMVSTPQGTTPKRLIVR
ncbi:MAG: T9SS type A sorting domain-containing protein [Bacteroidales bacterium]|nr:T9SS type A sorting domain-containing protein [Bacteroidales bacterium]